LFDGGWWKNASALFASLWLCNISYIIDATRPCRAGPDLASGRELPVRPPTRTRQTQGQATKSYRLRNISLISRKIKNPRHSRLRSIIFPARVTRKWLHADAKKRR
jgi:hypothetical protein